MDFYQVRNVIFKYEKKKMIPWAGPLKKDGKLIRLYTSENNLFQILKQKI